MKPYSANDYKIWTDDMISGKIDIEEYKEGYAQCNNRKDGNR